MPAAPPSDDALLARLLGGDAPCWRGSPTTPGAFLRACRGHGVTGLVHERLRALPPGGGWPRDIHDALAAEVRVLAARELLRGQELTSVLDRLASEGIEAILLKGAALAYTVYDSPASRPRADTDLLVRREDVEAVRRVMAGRGYSAPAYCGGDLLFCQFPLERTDAFGLTHTVDVHWRISTQPAFAGVLGYEEIAAAAVGVPALGPHARAAGPLHALLLACVHPAMHHRNAESLVWLYDVHLLASRLTGPDFERFAGLAIGRQVAAVCAHQLAAARARLGTRVSEAVMARLAASGGREPSAAYLRPGRHWRHDLVAGLRALPRWRDRWRLLREVALPGPGYMLQAYGLAPSALGAVVLPALYLHRLSAGSWKVLAGRK